MICETLQSEVNNFTAAFFGDIIKTDGAPGVVDWTLPCGLDIGLEENIRGVDEGIACYYLRLFRDIIHGLQGPAGDPGDPGATGYSGYTVSLASFAQPTSPFPFELAAVVNPVIKPGEIVFVDKSGWYLVLWVNENGTLGLSQVQTMLGALPIIPAGRFIIPTGPKGQDQTGLPGNLGQPGDRGDAGEQGPTGDPGADAEPLSHGPTQVNGTFIGNTSMADFQVRATTPAATLVAFGTTDATKVSFRLTTAGKYLFKVTSSYFTTGDSAVLYTGLVDTTTPANNVSPDPTGTNKFLPGSYTNSQNQLAGVFSPITLSCVIETTANYSVIQWQAFGQRVNIDPSFTYVTWVRLT